MYKGKKYLRELPDHRVYYAEVELKTLQVSPRAQRSLEGPRAMKYANNFVPSAVGTLVVNKRADGTYYIVDGMHRWFACCVSKRISKLTVEVHDGLTEEEEALLFLFKNRESRKPSSREEFKIAVTAGLPLYVDTQAVLDKHELHVSGGTANSVAAVNAILTVVDKYGPEIFDRALYVAEQAWGRSRETWDGVLLGGIGRFLGRHGDAVDDSALAAKLEARGTAVRWKGLYSSRATEGGTRSDGSWGRLSACYALLVEEWNKGRRKNRLEA